MKTLRILILSNVRPSRVLRLAQSLTNEVPGAEICGIAQRPFQDLPISQRVIATGSSAYTVSRTLSSRIHEFILCAWEAIMDVILFAAHGFSRIENGAAVVDCTLLQAEARKIGSAVYTLEECASAGLNRILAEAKPDLVVSLGLPISELAVKRNASVAVISAVRREVSSHDQRASNLLLEYAPRGCSKAITLASLNIPVQRFDGPTTLTLKGDLLLDDLLLQSVLSLGRNPQNLPAEVNEWAGRTIQPYIRDLEQSARNIDDTEYRVHRSRSRLGFVLDCLVLFSPLITLRNWYRRLRGRCPVLILTHHLISDRPHRMGLPTEIFWRDLQFLRKHYRIVSLAEAVRLLRSGNLKTPVVVLTFDDGYGENFVTLRAVTEELHVPVTLFVSTEPVETHTEFQHDVGRAGTTALPLTWDQIRYWQAHGAQFGSHTRTHFDCGSDDETRLISEIAVSKRDLESKLGCEVEFFAFPFGEQKNISPAALRIASATYPYFASSCGGENLPHTFDHRQHLHRKTHYQTTWELELELQSVFDLASRVKSWFLRIKTGFLAPGASARSVIPGTAKQGQPAT